MSEAAWFVIVFVGFAVVRLGIATAFFYAVLEDDDRCPECDAPTIRIRARGWNLLMPWFRTSYCIDCRWEGLLRHSRRPSTATAGTRRQLSPPRSGRPARAG
jgi:hypothetical protein